MKPIRVLPVDCGHFLKGMAGSLALPMMERHHLQAIEAMSAGPPRRLVCFGNHLGFWPKEFSPENKGKDFKPSLRDLILAVILSKAFRRN